MSFNNASKSHSDKESWDDRKIRENRELNFKDKIKTVAIDKSSLKNTGE